ncbi:OLC1v1033389C1 [Oldenlandia corymbosa var. corymbosa]|uniref:OLC1v1033389C1 n=1 Tax=Oldenlandia corymbosa var. corymbosa TaxID=529605 RepID=A0AAV1CR60_OLDCO|nr:OLC1v1033389C1 [Oldenlandia corymbosa var. corymbosa]
MSNQKDSLQNVGVSAKKISFEGLLINVVLRPFFRVVGSLFGQSSSLIPWREDNYPSAVDKMDLISISSSSDDSTFREIDEYRDESSFRDTATSSAASGPLLRQLPSSFSTAVTGGPPRLGSSARQSFITNGGSSSGDLEAFHARSTRDNGFEHPNHTNGGSNRPTKRPFASKVTSAPSFKPGMHASSSNQGALRSQTARDNHSEYYSIDDNDWPSSKRPRILPSSVHPSMPTSGRKYIVDMPGSQFRQNTEFGRSRAYDNNVVVSENKGSRVLPPSLAHGRSASSSSFVNLSGPSHQMGDVEENLHGTDERMLFQAALKDLTGTTGATDVPKGVLSVSLLPHQKIALAWLIEKEKGGVCVGGILADDQGLGKTISMIALIQMQKSSQDKYKSEQVSSIKPEALNLEDDEDVTVASAPIELKPKPESDNKEEILKGGTSKNKFHNMKPAAGTLVVCPASVLRQWARELDEKVTDEAKLSVLMYHGGNRTKDPVELAKYDVVITTYSIVTIEVPKQPLVDEEETEHIEEKYGLSSQFSTKKPKKISGNGKGTKGKKGLHSDASDGGALAKVRWFRIILDEAQSIKNHRTQVARACCSLRAKRRWCLSGTPIQNAIDELFSYFRFLRHDPYSNYKKFLLGIKVAISRDSNRGYRRLQVVLKAIMLRRTKGTLLDGKPIIALPPKTVHLERVEFSSEERAFYNQLESDSRSQFKAYAAAGTVNQNYANILLMLLRLRQACDHPLLVKGFGSDVTRRESSKVAKSLPAQRVRSLLEQLETSLAICGSCSDIPENAVVTICGHVFCFQCVTDHLTGEDPTCPEAGCKELVSTDVIFTKATLKECLSDDFSSDPSGSSVKGETSMVLENKSSSKIKAALQILESYCQPSIPSSEMIELVSLKPAKAIVFSQWTGMLDLLEDSLGNTGLQYRRLDGTMSLAARDKAVKDFNTRPEVTVMLMSLKAGNLGLNMVAACHVILLDLWWNPTTEDQAVDRAHRIGQTRAVTVTRLTIKDTVEDRILALQEEKRKMVASAFGEDPSGNYATRLTMEDLWNLFDVRGG